MNIANELRKAADHDEAEGGFAYILMRGAAAHIELIDKEDDRLKSELAHLRELYIGACEEVSSRGLNLQATIRELSTAQSELAEANRQLTGFWCSACGKLKSEHERLDTGALNCASKSYV